MEEINAGPDLDRRIAEKVMGWELPIEYGILYKDGTQSWGQSPQYTIDKFNNYHRQGIAERLLQRPDLGGWSPSTNIAHAWEVVEKIRPTACFDLYYINGWVASFDPSGNPNATADTAPLAICRAVLASLPTNHAGRETP